MFNRTERQGKKIKIVLIYLMVFRHRNAIHTSMVTVKRKKP